MTKWNIEPTEKFERLYKKYEKKQYEELVAVLNNLDTYHETLQHVSNPFNITSGFIHHEPKGIKAIDQTKADRKLKETRLYVYPDPETKTLYLLTLGDKRTQKEDLKFCIDYVKNMHRGKNGKKI